MKCGEVEKGLKLRGWVMGHVDGVRMGEHGRWVHGAET